VGLIVRERLTGEAPPRMRTRRRSVAALDRGTRRQGSRRLEGALRDQKAFAKVTRTILKDLEMGDDLAEDSESDGSDESGRARAAIRRRQRRRGLQRRSEMADAELSESEGEEGEETTAEMQADQTADPSDMRRNPTKE
jgi:cobaltochelatase CobT